jgi:peptidase S41-like protein
MSNSRSIHWVICIAATLATMSACSGGDPGATPSVSSRAAALRDMTRDEASEDLEQMFAYVRSLYGPYEYKQRRFGYDIAALEDQARSMLANLPGDDAFYSTAHWFLTRLQDGHVSLEATSSSDPIIGYQIGIFVQPVQGKALVAELFDESLIQLGIGYGDEVVAVDGVSPFALLNEYLKFDSIGNDVSNQHLIYHALIRPGYASSIRPVSPTAHVEFRRADGSEYSRDLIWLEALDRHPEFVSKPDPLSMFSADSFLSQRALEINAQARGSLASIGAVAPFFLNSVTAAAFNITPVTPNADMLARYGLDPAALPDIYAALYSYAGKSLLLIRQSTYDADDAPTRLAYYRAIMDQYDGFVDGLVVDQTHNPGGFLSYCVNFARLFNTGVGANVVQAMNADRRWVNALRETASLIDPGLASELSRNFELRASLVEAAYDAGQGISAPLPLLLDKDLTPDPQYVWTKPLLVLIDELAGSCGDVFPMLIKANKIAPLFGRRTMGLGGNVEIVGRLTNSDSELHLTRGLFAVYREDGTYSDHDFIENRGVEPDIEHVITVDDFRGGFSAYMEHFSQQIVSQIKPAE